MKIDSFRRIYKERNGVEINAETTIFKQHGAFIIIEGEKETRFKKFDDMLEYVTVNGKTVKDIVLSAETFIKPELHGGRGASSSEGGGRRKAFSHAKGSGGGTGETDFASRFNTGDRFQTEDKMANKFISKHANDKIEHGITVNEQGYVTQYVHGGATSVAIAGRKGEFVYHNHPAGADGMGHHFSDSDLLSTSMESSRGIAAVAPEGTYKFTKGKNFNASGFYKAVKNATVPKNMSYDEGVTHWLNKNAKKYGYSYEFIKRV